MITAISIEDPGQPEVLKLLEASDAYMASLYPPESNHLLDVRALRQPQVTFLVARIDGGVVGCGALVRAGLDWAEIKRMFIVPDARGRQLGRQMLRELECQALARGIRLLRLETGVKQPEALSLYRSAGFSPIEPFGSYRTDPLSTFMEKVVTA